MDVSKYLPTAGRVLTPIAMVIFLAYGIVQSQTVDGWWGLAVLAGAIASASGFEIVGILSGSALEKSWRMENWTKTAVSFLLLALYTGAAMWILWDNEAIRLLPLIAAIVYIVSSLSEGLDIEENEQKTAVSRQDEFDLAQAALDRDLSRQLKLKRQADKTAVLLAGIEVSETAVSPKLLTNLVPNQTKRAKQTKRDMVKRELETNHSRTNVEIGQVVGVSGQYVGRIRGKLNGSVTHG